MAHFLRLAPWLIAFVLTLSAATSRAWTEKALQVADPFSFTPNDLDLTSFKLEGPVLWQWVEGSFQWVKVDKKFEIPRAKVRLTVPATAKVTYQKQVFVPSADGKVEVPVVLTQERSGYLRNEILIEDATTKQFSRAAIVFQARDLRQPVSIDSSCSPYNVRVTEAQLPRSWVYVACRTIHPADDYASGAKVDLDLYWEMEESPDIVRINGRALQLEDGLTTSVAADSISHTFRFQRGGAGALDELKLEASVPERFHRLAFSLGLGPYSHQNVVRPFATVYGSYYFNESMKLAAFGAMPIRENPEVDVGLYLIAEQFRGLDERLSVNLLLGAHALSFTAFGEHQFAFSAPQGVEAVFRDFLAKRQNLMIGGFFYPSINQRSYVNTWVRYGGSTFVELNFIQWQEPVGAETYGAKSFGISLGFPLFRAL